jgi:small subunit ribosomal protein S1
MSDKQDPVEEVKAEETKAAPEAKAEAKEEKPAAKKTTSKSTKSTSKSASAKKTTIKAKASTKKEEAKEEAPVAEEAKAEEVVAEAPAEEPKAETTEEAPAADEKKTRKRTTRKKVDVEAEAEEAAPVAEVEEAEAEEEVEKFELDPNYTAPTKPDLNFDWNSSGKKGEDYSADERAKLEEQYNENLQTIAEHEVIEGVVESITKKEVVVNLNYKSDGVIPTNEFRYNPDLSVGDPVEVYVESMEDKDGQLELSHRKARTMRAWEKVNSALDTHEVITGFIKCRTKGGLIADVFGIEAFLPGSQIDVKPIRDYDIYVGKTMEFKVVKINQEFRNVVVSHKALIEAELEEQKVEIMSKLEKGQVLEGTVKNITSYGVFVDLGGVDGLIHITDLSWGRINHPEELVQLDEKINVVILDFDDDKKRIALGLKQLQNHPWDSIDENLAVGEKVKGKVVVLADYGAFVEISPGVEGLIHVSEMSWSQHLRTAKDFFSVGDEVEAVIMTMDREERKMSLSTRRLTPDPWEEIEAKFPVDSKVTGKVTNLSNFGVFVELSEGIDGLIHISDLSWSKKINHPSEFTKVGEDIEVVVLEIDKENRRLSLGHKQLEENPWDVFETVFTIGSVHQGTIINLVEKGALVAMPYGVEAFAPGRHLVTEDGNKLGQEAQNDFMVIEFKKDAKKIIVSHSKIHESKKRAEKADDTRKQASRGRQNRKAIQDISDKLEKSTLGDLDALSALKTDMEEAEKKAKK